MPIAIALALTACDAVPSTPAPVDDHISTPRLTVYPELQAYIASLDLDRIPAERRERLDELAAFVRARRDAGATAPLTFICTHNSRRSHMGQIWAAVAAAWHGVEGVETFSGGTEATAFNPRAVTALRRAGLHITPTSEGSNPRYRVSFSDQVEAREVFSKEYDDPSNPNTGFAAIMTCSEADEGCPVVFGAAARVSLPYVDPKHADGTPGELLAYDERSRQIAAEMFYLFSRVAG